MSTIYVTAIYKIYDRPYAEEVWKRFQVLAETIPIHLFCSEVDVPRATVIADVTGNVTIHVKEFKTFECHPILQKASNLPERRSIEKDTHNFMILMNAKTECLKLVKDVHPDNDYYVWLDAGISKIFKVPVTSFSYLTRTMPQIQTDKIVIPGCWNYNVQGILVTKYVNWRFCGGFFIVPAAHVDTFHTKMIIALQEIVNVVNIAIWETNVWAHIEPRLPIKWINGDHNETIFANLEQLKG